ncbi:hypothetical protein DH2020_001649 [Rehmannia glutinosa]|uniref:Uncharacterized protein n=1 Tax=Rehmannia glutinosa TaxID=99300 RepID=A0ABR0XZZ2_REHGL
MQNRLASLWRHVKGIFIKELSGHIYLFQFFHQLDLQRVLNAFVDSPDEIPREWGTWLRASSRRNDSGGSGEKWLRDESGLPVGGIGKSSGNHAQFGAVTGPYGIFKFKAAGDPELKGGKVTKSDVKISINSQVKVPIGSSTSPIPNLGLQQPIIDEENIDLELSEETKRRRRSPLRELPPNNMEIENFIKATAWFDPWLRDANNFRVLTPLIPTLADITVADLMIPGEKMWDVELLNEIFIPRDISEITAIPLSNSGTEDIMIWHFTRNGMYAVKSGYQVARSIFAGDDMLVPGDWSKLWKLPIPPKIKHFLWRACRDCLPNRQNLQRRGIIVSSLCVLCGASLENNWHIFVACPFALCCWERAELFDLTQKFSGDIESFNQWFFDILSKVRVEVAAKFSIILWSIWRQRNEEFWNHSHLSPEATVLAARSVLYEWGQANSLNITYADHYEPRLRCFLWHKPTQNHFKCNVDAAVFQREQMTGFGMVIRNDMAEFVACRTLCIHGVMCVKEAEAMGLKEALSWVKNLNLHSVLFEVDAKGVSDSVNGAENDVSEYGLLIKECRNFLTDNSSFSVGFVHREANTVAHELARISIFNSSPSVWVDPPSCIEDLLKSVCNFH